MGPFKNRKKKPAPKTVVDALTKLLAAVPQGEAGGFVIFGGQSDYDYVQYSLEPTGLLLNWPTMQKGGTERLPLFEAYLKDRGYQAIEPTDGLPLPEQIDAMVKGQYMILDDGMYCQVGRDIAEISTMTKELMASVFGEEDESAFQIQVAPHG